MKRYTGAAFTEHFIPETDFETLIGFKTSGTKDPQTEAKRVRLGTCTTEDCTFSVYHYAGLVQYNLLNLMAYTQGRAEIDPAGLTGIVWMTQLCLSL